MVGTARPTGVIPGTPYVIIKTLTKKILTTLSDLYQEHRPSGKYILGSSVLRLRLEIPGYRAPYHIEGLLYGLAVSGAPGGNSGDIRNYQNLNQKNASLTFPALGSLIPPIR